MEHRRRPYGARTWSGLLVAATGVVVLTAGPAGSHAIVRSTEPAIDAVVQTPPSEVVMEFNEPVEISFGSIRVFGTDGDRVDSAFPLILGWIGVGLGAVALVVALTRRRA